METPKVLKHVCILLDCTRGLSKLDLDFMQFLDSRDTAFQVVLTKGDLLSEVEVRKQNNLNNYISKPGSTT
jgi:GTP-binding protein EngB required for normal cell division